MTQPHSISSGQAGSITIHYYCSSHINELTAPEEPPISLSTAAASDSSTWQGSSQTNEVLLRLIPEGTEFQALLHSCNRLIATQPHC